MLSILPKCLCLISIFVSSVRTSNVTSFIVVDRQKLPAEEISSLLTELLENYDQRLRPSFLDSPLSIKVSMHINSIGPISEKDMSYAMDCYFRQSWKDTRLSYNGPNGTLAINNRILEYLWRPDTYFFNGRNSFLHKIPTVNRLIRLENDGSILMSSRLTIIANCPMHLEKFPVDSQNCPLYFGSYGYTEDDVRYEWEDESPVTIEKKVLMSQFDLVRIINSNTTMYISYDRYSKLMLELQLQRHTGYFLIQIYLPCFLIVILSWVAFFINREATSDRVCIGITCVLSLATISMDCRGDIPKVSYSTALDWFLMMCNTYVVASLLQFTGVHYFTKIGYGDMNVKPGLKCRENPITRIDMFDDDFLNQMEGLEYPAVRQSHGSEENVVEKRSLDDSVKSKRLSFREIDELANGRIIQKQTSKINRTKLNVKYFFSLPLSCSSSCSSLSQSSLPFQERTTTVTVRRKLSLKHLSNRRIIKNFNNSKHLSNMKETNVKFFIPKSASLLGTGVSIESLDQIQKFHQQKKISLDKKSIEITSGLAIGLTTSEVLSKRPLANGLKKKNVLLNESAFLYNETNESPSQLNPVKKGKESKRFGRKELHKMSGEETTFSHDGIYTGNISDTDNDIRIKNDSPFNMLSRSSSNSSTTSESNTRELKRKTVMYLLNRSKPDRNQQKITEIIKRLVIDIFHCFLGDAKYKQKLTARADATGINSLSKLDSFSRVAFPLSFVILNIFYWDSFYQIHQQRRNSYNSLQNISSIYDDESIYQQPLSAQTLKVLTTRPLQPTSRQSQHAHNISKILDELLSKYDRRLRPDFQGKPLAISVSMQINSLGPISEKDMSYAIDCYFRQSWLDSRLSHSGSNETLSISSKIIDSLWRPDTYFFNGRDSYVHTIPTVNRLVRLSRDGHILLSSRLTIKANCPMHLQKFPVDKQTCPLFFGSYSYTVEDVHYIWEKKSPVVIEKGVQLSQFDLIRLLHGNSSMIVNNDLFSRLSLNLELQRHSGYFLIQIYFPCFLIVILSWVAFFINREATSDRVQIGVTCVLTLFTISMNSRSDIPKVSYSTALDYFLMMCNIYVVATLLQFTGVHYFTKNSTVHRGKQKNLMTDNEYQCSSYPSSILSSSSTSSFTSDIERPSLQTIEKLLSKGVRPTLSEKSYRILNNYERIFNLQNSLLLISNTKQTTKFCQHKRHREVEEINDENEKERKNFENDNFVNNREGKRQKIFLTTSKEKFLREQSEKLNMKENSQVNVRRSRPLLFLPSNGRRSSISGCVETDIYVISKNTPTFVEAAPIPFRCKVFNEEIKRRFKRRIVSLFHCLLGDAEFKASLAKQADASGINSLSRLDSFSRVAFPLTFILLNLLYWYIYIG
ncbi:hypothetical protein SNEBB_000390 [Seison nebaliae]|nr:hypothetical protein SNEBB_000390 [Seison nebaliae]